MYGQRIVRYGNLSWIVFLMSVPSTAREWRALKTLVFGTQETEKGLKT